MMKVFVAGATRAIGTQLVSQLASAGHTVIGRTGHGHQCRSEALLTRAIRKRRFPIIGDGGGVWSFVHIEDSASATVAAVDQGGRGIYSERIDATLAPFRGRFAAQDVQAELLEGDASGIVVIVEFPDLGDARGWYDSEGYRSIRPLRAENSDTTLFIVHGVGPDHRATDILGLPATG